MDSCTFVLDAIGFASERHAGQTRKGERREPYINHPIEVAHLVSGAVIGVDYIAVAAAALHDTIEDTATTWDDIAARFGEEVADVVSELTDDPSLPRSVRKRLQVETAACKSLRARIIKIADKTSNLRAIAASPPADWSPTRRIAYACWSNGVVEPIRHTHPALVKQFDLAARDAVVACGATVYDRRLMHMPDRRLLLDALDTTIGRPLPCQQLWEIDGRPAAAEGQGEARIFFDGAWHPLDAWELAWDGRPLAFYMFDAAWPGLVAVADHLESFAAGRA